MSPTIYHSLNLLIVVVAVVFGWWSVSKLRRTKATYDARLLPFAYYSLSAVIVWSLQCVLLLVKPILVPSELFVDTGLLLGVIQNALWLAAVVPLYSKRSLQMSQTLPIFIALSSVIAAVTYRTGVLPSALFAQIEAISGFLIFLAIACSILPWRLRRLSAAVFAIYGYSQYIWRSLWLKPFTDIPFEILIAFPVLRLAVLFFWIKVISEMVKGPEPSYEETDKKVQQQLKAADLLEPFFVMISSTITDLEQERDAAHKAISSFHLTPLRSETFGSVSHPPREVCQLLAERCGIFILIIGERYGTKIEPEGISVVEFELQVALAQNPRKVLLYVKNGVSKREAELEEFLERLEKFNVGFFRALFKTPEELYEQIRRDIARWLTTNLKK